MNVLTQKLDNAILDLMSRYENYVANQIEWKLQSLRQYVGITVSYEKIITKYNIYSHLQNE